MTIEPIEDEAKRIVRGGNREASYGPPLQDFTRTAAMWSAILGIEVTPQKMALCMVALKLSRLVATEDHHDSMVDLVGYGICYQRIVEGEPTELVKQEGPHGVPSCPARHTLGGSGMCNRPLGHPGLHQSIEGVFRVFGDPE